MVVDWLCCWYLLVVCGGLFVGILVFVCLMVLCWVCLLVLICFVWLILCLLCLVGFVGLDVLCCMFGGCGFAFLGWLFSDLFCVCLLLVGGFGLVFGLVAFVAFMMISCFDLGIWLFTLVLF